MAEAEDFGSIEEAGRFSDFFCNEVLSDRMLILIEENEPVHSTCENKESSEGKVTSNGEECQPDSSNEYHQTIAAEKSNEEYLQIEDTVKDHQSFQRKVPIHSIILGAESDFFKNLLGAKDVKWSEQKEINFPLKHGETATFMLMIEMLYTQEKFIIDEDENSAHNVHSFIRLVFMCDRFLCKRLLFSLFTQYMKFVPTKIESLNALTQFVEDMETSCDYLSKQHEKWKEPYVKFIQNNIIPLETISDIGRVSSEISVRTLKVILSFDNVTRDVNNLLGFAAATLTNKQISGVDIEDILKSCSAKEKNFDAIFLKEVITSKLSPFGKWDGYLQWYIDTLENYIGNETQPQQDPKLYDDWRANTGMWGTVTYKIESNPEPNQYVMKAEDGHCQFIVHGYTLQIDTVTAKFNNATNATCVLTIRACLQNIKTQPFSPKTFTLNIRQKISRELVSNKSIHFTKDNCVKELDIQLQSGFNRADPLQLCYFIW